MSREIKFRAWDKKASKFVYLEIVQGSIRLPGMSVEFTDLQDWQQYTGLKDKNGVEIYEGDIVAIAFWNGVDMADIENGVIEWHEESSAFKWFSGEPSDANNYWLSHADVKHRGVIGNIHENQELLN